MTIKTEGTPLFVGFIMMAVAIAFMVFTGRMVSEERLAFSKMSAYTEHIEQELERAKELLHSLQGGIVQVDARTGVVLDLNIGALEIFGTRGLAVGETMFRAICEEEYRRKHKEHIFGDDWEAVWQKRVDEGALHVACSICGANGKEWRHIRIQARRINGHKFYDVFISPRRYNSYAEASAEADAMRSKIGEMD